MAQNPLGLAGFGLSVFGLGVSTLLRVLPMMGWQPSPVFAGILVTFGAVCTLAGLSIFAYLLIPAEATSRIVAIPTLLSRYRNVLLFWLLAVLVVVFMAWQSVAIYRLQPVERQLTLEQQRIMHAELQKVHDPIFVHVTWAPNHVEPFNYARSIEEQFASAKNANIGGGLESSDGMRMSLIHGKSTEVISMPPEFYLEFNGLMMFVPDVDHKPLGAVAIVEAMEMAHLHVDWATDERLGKHPTDSGSEDECILLVGITVRD